MKIIGIAPEIMWSKDHYLRKPSRCLEKEEVQTPEFKNLVNYMFQALYEAPTGVGLAAPQIGLQIRLVVIDVKRDGKKPLVLINPEFSPIDDEMVDSGETCLSFPKLGGYVRRYKNGRVTYRDINFVEQELLFNEKKGNFLAIVCQHEIDHLNGNVYVDKAEKMFEPQNHYSMMADKAMDKLFGK